MIGQKAENERQEHFYKLNCRAFKTLWSTASCKVTFSLTTYPLTHIKSRPNPSVWWSHIQLVCL